MKISLKSDVKVNDKTKLYKFTEGTVLAVSWSERDKEQYLVSFKDGSFMIDKKYIMVLK